MGTKATIQKELLQKESEGNLTTTEAEAIKANEKVPTSKVICK